MNDAAFVKSVRRSSDLANELRDMANVTAIRRAPCHGNGCRQWSLFVGSVPWSLILEDVIFRTQRFFRSPPFFAGGAEAACCQVAISTSLAFDPDSCKRSQTAASVVPSTNSIA